jgi:hypothetical protein
MMETMKNLARENSAVHCGRTSRLPFVLAAIGIILSAIVGVSCSAGQSPEEQEARQNSDELEEYLAPLNQGLPTMVHDKVRADSVSYSGSSLIYRYTVLFEEGRVDEIDESNEIEALVTQSSDAVMNLKCSEPEWVDWLKSGGTFRLVFVLSSGGIFAEHELGYDDCKDASPDIDQ